MLTSMLHSYPSWTIFSMCSCSKAIQMWILSLPLTLWGSTRTTSISSHFGMDLNVLGSSSCSQTHWVCKVYSFVLLIVILPNPGCSIFSSSIFQISITSWLILHQTLSMNKRCYVSEVWCVNNFSQRSHLLQQMQMSPQKKWSIWCIWE